MDPTPPSSADSATERATDSRGCCVGAHRPRYAAKAVSLTEAAAAPTPEKIDGCACDRRR